MGFVGGNLDWPEMRGMWLKSWIAWAATIVCVLIVVDARAELVIRGYSPGTADRYDRFLNSPSFIGNPYDWSGVARTSAGRWATMVSSNYFLSATHFAPSIGDMLTIYGSNDISGPQQEVEIIGGQQIAGTDLWLGEIDVATNFTTYGVLDNTSVVGHDVFMFGLVNSGPVTAQMRLGRNTVEAYFQDFPLGGSTGDIYLYDYDDPTGGVGDDEAKVEGGDSGAPTFLIMDGKPVLLGFHWFKYEGGDFSDASTGSGDTAVARYISDVNQAMVGQQLVTVVPEPGALTLFTLPIVGWVIRRRYARSAN